MDMLEMATLVKEWEGHYEKTRRLTGVNPALDFVVQIAPHPHASHRALRARFHEFPPQVVILASGDGEVEHWVPLREAPYVLARDDAGLQSALQLGDAGAKRRDAIRGVTKQEGELGTRKRRPGSKTAGDSVEKIQATILACRKISDLLDNTIRHIRHTVDSQARTFVVSFYISAINPMLDVHVDPEMFLIELDAHFKSLTDGSNYAPGINSLQNGGNELRATYIIPADYAYELLRAMGINTIRVGNAKEAEIVLAVTMPANISQPYLTYYTDSGSFVFEVNIQ